MCRAAPAYATWALPMHVLTQQLLHTLYECEHQRTRQELLTVRACVRACKSDAATAEVPFLFHHTARRWSRAVQIMLHLLPSSC